MSIFADDCGTSLLSTRGDAFDQWLMVSMLRLVISLLLSLVLGLLQSRHDASGRRKKLRAVDSKQRRAAAQLHERRWRLRSRCRQSSTVPWRLGPHPYRLWRRLPCPAPWGKVSAQSLPPCR